AAQDSINHGYTIELRYWGDDPSSDDLPEGPVHPKTVYAAADGLHFEHSLTMSRELLDEDTPIIVDPDDGDEIYVGSRLLAPSGKTVSLVESNRITGNFWSSAGHSWRRRPATPKLRASCVVEITSIVAKTAGSQQD